MNQDRRTKNSWVAMRSRCLNTDHPSYQNYGGRGITVCDKWMTYEGFVEDMGVRPDGLSLERLDNDGNYEPSNCVWATRKEQNRNHRRNQWIEYNGQKKIIEDWAELTGLNTSTLRKRLARGWSVERALKTEPIQIIPTSVDMECPVCGASYVADGYRLSIGKQTTCSRKCSYVYRNNKKKSPLSMFSSPRSNRQ